MKEALEKDVDLVEYGQKIENDLRCGLYRREHAPCNSPQVISAVFVHGRSIDMCDDLLAQIQDLLHVYQKDLSGVANEIRILQVSLFSKVDA